MTREQAPMNKNVRMVLIFSALNGAAAGVWGWQVLAMYLYVLEDGSNAKVGFAEGIQGACKAAMALLAGWASDRYRRDRMLRVSAAISALAIALTVVALTLFRDDGSLEYGMFCFASAAWGLFNGASAPALEAIFADSVSTGARSRMYTYKFVLYVLPYWGIGPALTMILFARLGDQWSLPVLRTIILCGMGLAVLPTISLLWFDDDFSLGSESEAVRLLSDTAGAASKAAGHEPLLAYKEAKFLHERRSSPASAAIATAAAATDTETETETETDIDADTDAEADAEAHASRWKSSRFPACCCPRPRHRAIPFILVISDIIMGLASGMTLKFFPIFFAEEVEMNPIQTTAVYPVSTIVLCVFSLVAQRVSNRLGRVRTVLIGRLMGISLLVAIALLRSRWHSVWLMAALYVVRTAMNNAQNPLLKSILMDYTRKKHRGKINSMESVSQFGWSGSAILGGYLLDHYSWRAVFLVTAALQYMSWLLTVPLLGVVIDEKSTCTGNSKGSKGKVEISTDNEGRCQRHDFHGGGKGKQNVSADVQDKTYSHISCTRGDDDDDDNDNDDSTATTTTTPLLLLSGKDQGVV